MIPAQRPAAHDQWDEALQLLLDQAAYREAGRAGDVTALLEPYSIRTGV